MTHLFGVPSASWSAWGIWMTLLVYAVIAGFAFRQLGEARRLRLDQARPFVIVDVAFRSILMELSIRNVGQTAAGNVVVKFDERLESTIRDSLDWQDSTFFTNGMALMAPGRVLRFLFDQYPARHNSSLGMTVTGVVQYEGYGGRENYNEPFIIDLTNYWGARLPEKGLPDLVDEVTELRKTLERVSGEIAGLSVSSAPPVIESASPPRAGDMTDAQEIEAQLAGNELSFDVLRTEGSQWSRWLTWRCRVATLRHKLRSRPNNSS